MNNYWHTFLSILFSGTILFACSSDDSNPEPGADMGTYDTFSPGGQDFGGGSQDFGGGSQDTSAGSQDTGAGSQDTGAGSQDTGGGSQDASSTNDKGTNPSDTSTNPGKDSTSPGGKKALGQVCEKDKDCVSGAMCNNWLGTFTKGTCSKKLSISYEEYNNLVSEELGKLYEECEKAHKAANKDSKVKPFPFAVNKKDVFCAYFRIYNLYANEDDNPKSDCPPEHDEVKWGEDEHKVCTPTK